MCARIQDFQTIGRLQARRRLRTDRWVTPFHRPSHAVVRRLHRPFAALRTDKSSEGRHEYGRGASKPKKNALGRCSLKLRSHFLANLGRVLGAVELRDVAGNISEWARRCGNCVLKRGTSCSRTNDRADLKPGEYLLESAKPQPAFAGRFLRKRGQLCWIAMVHLSGCAVPSRANCTYDPGRKTRLHIGHVIDKSLGGSDDPSNLAAICSVCNEGAANISPAPGFAKLLVQVRRATSADQREVLNWLRTKFKD